MEKLALLVRLEARHGKEADVENFLKSGLALVKDEPETRSWYPIKLGPSTFGIFNTYTDEADRDAHLSGKVTEALMTYAESLIGSSPAVEKTHITAVK